MIEYIVSTPTIPIPFNTLLKVVAIVDAGNREVRALLDLLTAQGIELEVTDRYDRDASDRKSVV